MELKHVEKTVMDSPNQDTAGISPPQKSYKTKINSQVEELHQSVNELTQRTTLFSGICVLLQGLALLFHVIAFSTRGWGRTQIYGNENKQRVLDVSVGLWETCTDGHCNYIISRDLHGNNRPTDVNGDTVWQTTVSAIGVGYSRKSGPKLIV